MTRLMFIKSLIKYSANMDNSHSATLVCKTYLSGEHIIRDQLQAIKFDLLFVFVGAERSRFDTSKEYGDTHTNRTLLSMIGVP